MLKCITVMVMLLIFLELLYILIGMGEKRERGRVGGDKKTYIECRFGHPCGNLYKASWLSRGSPSAAVRQ